MKTLSEMLDSVLNQTKFDCGRMEETTYGPTRWNYGSRPEETISPEELRDIIWARYVECPRLQQSQVRPGCMPQ